MTDKASPSTERTIRRLSLLVVAAVALLFGVMGGLAAATRISGAVIASGTLVVDSYVKPVKHLKGGIARAILVKNGDHVAAGQVLVRLDDTQTKANLAIIRKRLNELSARTARLAAERDGRQDIAFPTELLSDATDADVAAILAGERRLFRDRQISRDGQKSQLHERIQQLRQEIDGLVAQEEGKRQEIALIAKELGSLQGLLDQGIISATKVYSLQRESASLNGDLGNLVSSIAQTKGKIAETELQILQIDADRSSEVSEQLRQAESDSGQFAERLIAAEDDLKRIDIKAPQSGIVDQLSIHAEGAVISPAEAILQIVPDKDALVAELKLAPQDIDQITVGQAVSLRFPAFNQRITPELNGHVDTISADLTTDQRSGQSYYVVRVKVAKPEWDRLGQLTPLPGMPVEAFLQTGERSVLAYLTKPMTDQIRRAFRED
ncbi:MULTISPECIES: HlyD family type I secretion periplasmic adaptor subunit [unclassified Rhizobium]|uniref:HlyD family type I secretion periplasmic adaptor subunit n=1 Tax=unclassified Rhizobium TaxID=2613769 RepID=UPI0016181AA6|nr:MULTISPECIES: HlyD family type I secretion periplasmic adaptor subunit [unclassified Rhizobium]MBB3289338.1 HlyD family secretion protein [Rhizobium sp. BK252]MBB3404262.1 HlyD family secretion protein [Rhizobium sp. BK289]MBB3416665.1 HlyD family secretion protein [Rhizobium sp. BK284]MBB3484543.1 HlyD family secretion protein [Rhizobium sp. BK347]MDK4721120.1 HlyD family type I secretion periplasmic adaptor subunit [Rhizobium sp. CNPSo 3968]